MIEFKPQFIEIKGNCNPDDQGMHGYPYRMKFGDTYLLVIAPSIKIKKYIFRLIVIPDLGKEWENYCK